MSVSSTTIHLIFLQQLLPVWMKYPMVNHCQRQTALPLEDGSQYSQLTNITQCHIKSQGIPSEEEEVNSITHFTAQCFNLQDYSLQQEGSPLHPLNLHWAPLCVETYSLRIKAKIQSFCIKTRKLCLVYNRKKQPYSSPLGVTFDSLQFLPEHFQSFVFFSYIFYLSI